MFNGLILLNLPNGAELPSALLSYEQLGRCFILRTCQRTLVLGHEALLAPEAPNDKELELWPDHPRLEVHLESQAYLYMLETICGLKSRLLGENEIVGQFKTAFWQFSQAPECYRPLIRVLEKLFQDAKDIRTQYLIGLGQKTYASLTRKILLQAAHAKEVLILGSGNLAIDVLHQLKKKTRVFLVARNETKMAEIKTIHDIETLSWEKQEDFLKFPHIVNTIGHEHTLWDEVFFRQWHYLHRSHDLKPLFVDLAAPSPIRTELNKTQGVYRLQDIMEEGAIKEHEKLTKIHQAKKGIGEIVQKRLRLSQDELSRRQKYQGTLWSPRPQAQIIHL